MEKASSSRTGENWQIDEFMARKRTFFKSKVWLELKLAFEPKLA